MRPVWFLLAVLWAGSHCSSSSKSPPLLLVLSLDGFWYKYRSLYKTPHLDRLAAEGVQAEYLRNAYVTKTFPNHFTIATGLYEESHGIVANAMFDPVLNETFDESSREPKWWDNGFSLPIWAANQMHGGRSGSMMWPGGDVPIHGVTTHYVQSFDAALNFSVRVDRVIGWFLDSREPANCVFFYYEEPDATGHVHGPLSPITGARVEAVDALVGELVAALKRAKLWDRIHLLVVSDHGMAPVTHVSALDEVLPADLYRAYGTSPVFNILPSPGREDEVHRLLSQAASRLHFRVYRSSEIPPEYHYQHNARILPILVEAEPGWDLVRSKQDAQENGTCERWQPSFESSSLPWRRSGGTQESAQPPICAAYYCWARNFRAVSGHCLPDEAVTCTYFDLSVVIVPVQCIGTTEISVHRCREPHLN